MNAGSNSLGRLSVATECPSACAMQRNRGASWIHGLASLAALTLAVAICLAGCDAAKPPEKTLVVGATVWPGYEPLFLARQLEYFSVPDIKLAEYSSNTQVRRAFRNGTIQVAALTLPEVLMLRESKIDACVILIVDISDGGDAILAMPGIKDVKGLKGKRVGVENTSLSAYVLARALEKSGLASTDIIVVPREIEEHESAISKKEVDAVVTYEPVLTRLLNLGMVKIFDSSMIPGEIVDVLIVRRETLESHSAQLTLLLEGWFKSLQYLKEKPEAAAERMSNRLQLKPKEVLASYENLRLPSYEENLEILGGPKPALNETVTRVAETMEHLDLLKPNTRLDQISCARVLKTLSPPASAGNTTEER